MYCQYTKNSSVMRGPSDVQCSPFTSLENKDVASSSIVSPSHGAGVTIIIGWLPIG